jgi:hypothetical protein
MAVPKGMFSVITIGKSLVSHVAGSLLVATAVSLDCRGAVGPARIVAPAVGDPRSEKDAC